MNNSSASIIGVWALSLAVAAGCASTATISSTRSQALLHPGHSRILGRIQLYKGGKPLRVGPAKRPLVGWLEGEKPLTELSFRNLDTNATFALDIATQDGRFEVTLPPGRYGVGLRYYIYLSGTPARFDVPEADRQFYIGTLQVNFFARTSMGGAWAATAGGVVPEEDSQFAVADEWNGTMDNAPSLTGTSSGAFEKRLMRIGRE